MSTHEGFIPAIIAYSKNSIINWKPVFNYSFKVLFVFTCVVSIPRTSAVKFSRFEKELFENVKFERINCQVNGRQWQISYLHHIGHNRVLNWPRTTEQGRSFYITLLNLCNELTYKHKFIRWYCTLVSRDNIIKIHVVISDR